MTSPHTASASGGRSFCLRLLRAALLLVLTGCAPSVSRYVLIEQSLQAHDPKRADAIVEGAHKQYGSKSQVLYGMDRGMTLHLAGEYQQSNAVLDRAEQEVDKLFTRSIRTEAAAFLTNDTFLPYEGDPYEQVMINVIKALNYALMGNLTEALVEARRIDHRLNVLSDSVTDKHAYREDPFARYLTGILYEATGDINNAFIAYRKAFEAYDASRGWSGTAIPPMLRADLLRMAEGLHLSTELRQYQEQFPGTTWTPLHEQQQLAQVVMIGYNGRAPHKEDHFVDLPISLDALQLVLLNKGVIHAGNRRDHRAVDSVLYGLNGRVVRVALPALVAKRTPIAYTRMTLSTQHGQSFSAESQLMANVTAVAEKALSERLPGITTKALARAAVKFAAAEAGTRAARNAASKDDAAWVGLLVGLLTKGWAVASEEADKRSWRTLPGQIHVTRIWVPPGDYDVRPETISSTQTLARQGETRPLSLQAGQTMFLVERVIL